MLRHNAWLWVFCSDEITLFDITPGRGHDVPQRMLGDEFSGILHCDGFVAYDALGLPTQRCNAHPLRRIAGLQETLTDIWDHMVLAHLQGVFQEASALSARRDEMTAIGYRRRCTELRNRFSQWLKHSGQDTHDEVGRLGRHLALHRKDWFRFLDDPDLHATNNQGERQIRPGVITRKTGGCNKTWSGAEATAAPRGYPKQPRSELPSAASQLHRSDRQDPAPTSSRRSRPGHASASQLIRTAVRSANAPPKTESVRDRLSNQVLSLLSG